MTLIHNGEPISVGQVYDALDAIEELRNEDAWNALAIDLRQYPNEPILNLLASHFPQVVAVIESESEVTE